LQFPTIVGLPQTKIATGRQEYAGNVVQKIAVSKYALAQGGTARVKVYAVTKTFSDYVPPNDLPQEKDAPISGRNPRKIADGLSDVGRRTPHR
jgi:hypothetical protein